MDTAAAMKTALLFVLLSGAAASKNDEEPLHIPHYHGPFLRHWQHAYDLASRTLANLSPWQRVRLVHGKGWRGWQLTPGFYVGTTVGHAPENIPWLKMQDSGNGFRSMLPSTVGTTIVWPSPLSLAATWDIQAVGEQAGALATEFRGKGANAMLGPGLNVNRIARGGRNFEYLPGEDPFLGATLTRSFIFHLQRKGVMAVLKHFGFNEQETNRNWVSSIVDERTAWELYYPPFEAGIDVGAAAIMCSYNKVNYTYACEHDGLLIRDLRGRMNFKGFVMSDWGAAHSSGAIQHGLDMDMPGNDPYFQYQALLNQNLSQPLHRAARRILASIYHLRLEEADKGCTPPLCLADLARNVTTEEHRSLALRTASKAVVVLRNEGVLPLNTSKIRKLGVVGMAADAQFATFGASPKTAQGLPEGDYYSGGGSGHVQGSNATLVTTLEAITKRAAADKMTVLSANTTRHHPSTRPLDTLLEEVDLAVVVAGAKTVESQDRSSLLLDDGADDLIRRVSKAKPTVVLLMIPGAVLMPWHDQVSGIAVLFYGGEASGEAFTSILFGDLSPVGKLPIMMPLTEADTIEPAQGSVALYSEGLLTSYRNHSHKAVFPFGHGLSYTSFKMHVKRVLLDRKNWMKHLLKEQGEYPGAPAAPLMVDTLATLAINVVNSGNRTGSEVIQGYLRFPKVPGTPHLQLRSFRRTRLLLPGENEVIWLHFNRRELSTYTPSSGWVLQDEVLLFMGTSSTDLNRPVLMTPKKFGLPAVTSTSVATTGSLVPSRAPPSSTQVHGPHQVSTSSKATLLSGTRSTTPDVLSAAKVESTSTPIAAVLRTSPPPTTTKMPKPVLRAEPGPPIPAVAGPTARPPKVQATDANNWVLYALQPVLLILVVLGAVLATQGAHSTDSDSDDTKLPMELMLEGEELPTWEYVYQGDGVASPLIRTSDGRVHTRAPL